MSQHTDEMQENYNQWCASIGFRPPCVTRSERVEEAWGASWQAAKADSRAMLEENEYLKEEVRACAKRVDEWEKEDSTMRDAFEHVCVEAETFCKRVEAGEVKSKRTYAAFKQALSLAMPFRKTGV